MEMKPRAAQTLWETLSKPRWRFLSQLFSSSSAVICLGGKYSDNVLS